MNESYHLLSTYYMQTLGYFTYILPIFGNRSAVKEDITFILKMR